MENTIFVQAAKFLRERRNNRRWRITVCCLAVFVVCGTAWALSRNGQAFVSSGAVLDCPMVVHEHTHDCFNEEGRQICGEADYVFHTHDDYCYDMDGQLVCKLEEVEEHEHTADCFETITTLDCGYGTIPAGESSIEETNINSESGSAEGETLVCGREEHTHSEDCYGQGERTLVCDQEEGGHTHDDSCYEENTVKELVCKKGESEDVEESGHTHDDDCYKEITEKELVCGQEEGGHEHSEACYGETGEIVPTCGMEEHTHSEACYEKQSGSGEQGSGDGADVEEPESHVHDETCTRKVRKLVCGKKGAHIHSSDECYYGEELICEVVAVRSVEEHAHDKKCFRVGEDEEFTKIYRDDQIIVTAVYTGLAQIPKAAVLRVEMISEDSSDYEKDLIRLTETEGALVENSDLAMLLQIGFYTTDERIRPKDTVHFTVQFLDDSLCKKGDEVTVARFADSGVELIVAADIDEENVTEFDLEEFADLDIGIIIGGEHDRKCVLTYEGAGYIMSIALEEDTKISKDAELTIDQLTQENSPEGYAERLAQLREKEGMLAGEDDMAMLLRVWISDNGGATGLKEKAEVSVQFLDDKIYAEGDAVMVASFVDDGVCLISGTDIDGEGTTTFLVEELSELAFLAPGERAGVLTYEGEDYIVTVALGADTRVPEDAELMVEEITKESDPALYAERLARLESVDGVLSEEEMIAHLLHMWVVLDGEEIALDETVDVTVQFVNSRFYFEGDAVKAAHFMEEDGQQYFTMLDASDIDADISTSFVSEGLNDFAFAVDDAYTMVYEGDGFMVTVRFKDAAKIPADAELIAKRITEESDPEEFTAREDQLQDEIKDELIALGALFEIGFYDAGGEEIEPQDVVDVKIRLLDRKTIEEADSVKVAHFVEDAEKEGETVEIIKEVEVTEDGDGSLSTSFQTESFSQYAITVEGEVDSERTFRKAMELAQKESKGKVALGADIVFTKNPDEGDDAGNAVPVKADHEVTLDLNGYTITVDGKDGKVSLVDIYGILNIVDSSKKGGLTKVLSGAVAAPTFNHEKETNHLSKMTCSVVESTVIAASRGSTKEDIYTYTLTDHGAIVGKNNKSPLLYVPGGKLSLSDGVIIAENENRAIEVRTNGGGTVDLNDCYLVGNSATNSLSNNGGAIYCESGVININEGAVISSNEGARGGGIYATDVLTDANGEGGTKHLVSVVNMDGGYVTNNTATTSSGYGGGGGGMYFQNSALMMTGGYITGNTTYLGGGGVAFNGRSQEKTPLIQNGTIASNVCGGDHGEGGGIALYDISIIEINCGQGNSNKVYITNNRVTGGADWGGGGLFVGQNASASLFDTLITGNSAEGFGGGLGGCSTGRIIDMNNSKRGAAIYDNSASGKAYAGNSTKNEDFVYSNDTPVFWERDNSGRYYFQDYFSVLYTYMEKTMLGGGSEEWDGTVDGERVDVNLSFWQSSYISGLTAFPSDADKRLAENVAKVYINGNFSAVHGGGIMCNGIMVIGENKGQVEISTAMELIGTKKLTGSTEDMEQGQFSFTVYPETALKEEKHNHDNNCYDNKNPATGKLICGLEQGEPVLDRHEHNSSCYKVQGNAAGGTKYILNCDRGIVATGRNGEFEAGRKEENGTVTDELTYNNALISFDPFLTFDLQRDLKKDKENIGVGDEWVYIYYIKEDEATEGSQNLGIARDHTVYKLDVTVRKVDHGKIGISNIEKYYDDIVKVELSKTVWNATSKSWEWNTPIIKESGLHDDFHAIKISLDDANDQNAAFNNKKTEVNRLEVQKSWDAEYGLPSGKKKEDEFEWVSVALFEKGKYKYWDKKVDPEKYKDENGKNIYEEGETEPRDGELTQYGRLYLRADNWTAGWEDLPDALDIDHIEVREIDVKYSEARMRDPNPPANRIEPAVWTFTPKYEYKNEGETAKVTVTNIPKTFGIQFIKVGYKDSNGNPVGNGKNGAIYGAKFEIYDEEGKVPGPLLFEQVNDGYVYIDAGTHTDRRTTTQLTTNIDGEIKISNLWWGKYRIKEVEAPVGYEPVHDHLIDFSGATPGKKVICTKTGENEDAEDCGEFVELGTIQNPDRGPSNCFDYVDDVLSWRMEDPEDKFELPETGGKGTTIFYVLGGILVLGCSVILISRKRAKK